MKKYLMVLAMVAVAASPLAAATRGVVSEEFGSLNWGGCPAADAAFGQVADEVGIDKFVPVNWITEGVSPEADARASFYNISLLPTNMFDGVFRVEGGTYATYLAAYNNRRTVPSPLKVEFLARSYSSNKASVKARVTLDQDISAGAVCHIILWEDKVNYNGHLWRFVERKMYPAKALTITKKGQSQIFKQDFALNAGWNKARLGATVIVQRPAAKNVLNGTAIKLVDGVAVEATSLGRVKALYN